jgi:predicted  nucleic acid-binding Zn-ribbon protein
MSEIRRFYCLRCQHRFDVDFDPKRTVERSCPKCGSNSVRAETPAAAARHEARQGGSHGTGH